MTSPYNFELPHTEQITVGATEVDVIEAGEMYIDTDYAPETLSVSRRITTRFGEVVYPARRGATTLSALDYSIQSHLSSLNTEVYYYNPECAIRREKPTLVVLSHDHYLACFTPGAAPPAWAGVCIRDGMIIYDGDYLNAVWAGDGNYGGYTFSPDYFYRELGHEMGHLDDLRSIFMRSESMADYFDENSRFVLDGMRELIVGITQSDEEFSRALKDHMQGSPLFSTDDLTSDFFHVDGSPAGVNLAYQYSARWMQALAPYINGWFQQKFESKAHNSYIHKWVGRQFEGGKALTPYQGIFAVWVLAVDRYNVGERESYYDTLCTVFGNLGVTKEYLLELEKTWRQPYLQYE